MLRRQERFAAERIVAQRSDEPGREVTALLEVLRSPDRGEPRRRFGIRSASRSSFLCSLDIGADVFGRHQPS